MTAMPPLLLIDAGNSRVKWAVSSLRGRFQMIGEAATSDVTAASIRKLAGKFPGHRVVLASVVPRFLPWFQSAFGKSLYNLTGNSSGLPLHFAYPTPAEVGADRIAAAIAAQAEVKFPVIIVSCGTATAFTVLDQRGAFSGGAIAPGLQTQLDALLDATAQLPATSLRAPRRLPAKSSEEAIRAGVFLNFQGGAKEIVARLFESLPGAKPRILLTGGHAEALRPIFGAKAEVRPLLVFEGLRIMGARIFFASVS